MRKTFITVSVIVILLCSYHTHENTPLCSIYTQLREKPRPGTKRWEIKLLHQLGTVNIDLPVVMDTLQSWIRATDDLCDTYLRYMVLSSQNELIQNSPLGPVEPVERYSFTIDQIEDSMHETYQTQVCSACDCGRFISQKWDSLISLDRDRYEFGRPPYHLLKTDQIDFFYNERTDSFQYRKNGLIKPIKRKILRAVTVFHKAYLHFEFYSTYPSEKDSLYFQDCIASLRSLEIH